MAIVIWTCKKKNKHKKKYKNIEPQEQQVQA